MKLVCVIVLLFIHSPLLAATELPKKSDILWYHPNFPPANFVDGLMAGLGYNDQVEKFIANQMVDYSHSYVVASYKRILHNLNHSNGCAVGVFKTEKREQELLFSLGYSLFFPNGVVIKKDDLNKFTPYLDDKSQFIFINKLIQDLELSVGIAEGRIYKGVIDQAIEKYITSKHLRLRSNSDVFSGLLNMLDKGRIDYIFGLPSELEYHTSLGVLEHEMKFIPVAEMPKYSLGHIVCSKNSWGKKAIADINQVLLRYRTHPKFLRFYQFWLDFDSKKRHVELSNAELN